MIIALVGGKGEMWGQSGVDGYTYKTTETYTCSETLSDATEFKDKTIYLRDKQKINNYEIESVFTLGNNVRTWIGGSGYENFSHNENTVSWGITDTTIPCYITLEGFATTIYATTVLSSRKVIFTSSSGLSTELSIPAYGTETKEIFWSLSDNHTINISFSGNATAIYYYKYLSYTYTLSYYELDVYSLESAINTASKALELITDETIKGYLETAITNANSFKDACAFPNSYWNGSSVGKTPTDVTATAEKLNAITNYLIARTNANKYEKDNVPNAVYDWLHTYDQYNPNDIDANTINTATNDINTAISAADATTSAYLSALNTIASAENSSAMTNDAMTLTADIKNAKEQLEQAKSVEEINSALANIKSFDTIKFNAESEVEEGNTLDNPAYANSDKAITYKSSDDKIIEIDGTTLKALKPGIVTITATTTTGNGYYGYATTKEFTVTPKAVILYPDKKCTIVPYITYPEITLERSFSAKKHYTLTLPFDSNISDIGGDYAAQLALVTYNKADGYTLYFQKVTDGQMVANQPYIVYAENGFKKSLKWVNITVAETIEAKGVNNDRTQGWTMQGNYTPGFPMAGNYGVAEGLFRKGGIDSKINAYTAYFTFLGTEKVRARVAVMDEGGNTTYIGELKDLDGNAAEEVFGIDGMRLPEMRKGINIVRQKDGSVRKIVK